MNKEEKAKLWADRIQQYKTSGQTCKQWCAENDIPLSTMVSAKYSTDCFALKISP